MFRGGFGDFLPKQSPMVACELVGHCENRQGIHLDLDSASGGVSCYDGDSLQNLEVSHLGRN